MLTLGEDKIQSSVLEVHLGLKGTAQEVSILSAKGTKNDVRQGQVPIDPPVLLRWSLRTSGKSLPCRGCCMDWRRIVYGLKMLSSWNNYSVL